MSMISGTDIILEISKHRFDFRALLAAVAAVWPDALVQDADDEKTRPIADAKESQEFFVYKDRAGAESWCRDGWTEEHGNDMVHFLVVPAPARLDVLHLTIVIGSATSETNRLVAAVSVALGVTP